MTGPTRGMRAEVEQELSFGELVQRLQHDDRAAVGVLIERYGASLRRWIERALRVGRLAAAAGHSGRVDAEASDVFQTVLLLFLARLRRQREVSGGGRSLHF